MSVRDRTFAYFCQYVAKPMLWLPLPWRMHRAGFDLSGRTWRHDDLEVRQTSIAGISCRVVARKSGAVARLIWLHGGGFTMGSHVSHMKLCDALARLGFEVTCPDYRLAPEHPFPAAYDDCLAVCRAAIAEGPVAICGESAGGNLALGVTAALLADGLRPSALVLASPAVNLDPDRPVPDHRDMLLPVRTLRRMVADYAGRADPTDPRLSPIHAEYPDAPPVLIQCSEGEILEEDSDAIAGRLRSQGAQVTMQKTAGMPHAFQIAAGMVPEADKAVARIATFIKAAQ